MGFSDHDATAPSLRTFDLVQSLGFQLEGDVLDAAWFHQAANLIKNPRVLCRGVQDPVHGARHKARSEGAQV